MWDYFQLVVVFHRLASISIFVVFLVSCDTASSITPHFSQPESTVEHIKSPSTMTVLPTSPSILSVTPNITQTAFAQDMVSAQLAEQTLVAQYPSVCKDLYAPREFSPDDLWIVELCYSEDDKDLILTLSNKETRVLWKLFYRDYLFDPGLVPDGSMSIVHWSSDGTYVYFNSFVHSSGRECFDTGGAANAGMGLFRLDLATGITKTILPVRDNYGWYRFSFSPTGRRLVYGASGRELKVLDIKTGQLININSASNSRDSGGYTWSPDGLKLVYVTRKSANQGEIFINSLRLVDAKSGNEQIILESTEDCFAATSWTEDNILILEKNYGESLIEFDLDSNQIISETATTQ